MEVALSIGVTQSECVVGVVVEREDEALDVNDVLPLEWQNLL